MKLRSFVWVAFIISLLPLSACQVIMPVFITNTLNEACTIRISLSDKNSLTSGQYEYLRYGKIVIRKAGDDTFKQLDEKLKPTKLNARTVELILPAESTVYIGSRSSVRPSPFDTLRFKTSKQEIWYTEPGFSKVLKQSGKLFSFAKYYLYTIK